MADTQFIKRVIEPHMREWLETQFPGSAFAERSVQLPMGSFKFDAVSVDESVVAVFLSSRPKTSTGNENTGGVRKALNDIQYLKLVSARTRLAVFTDNRFRDLIRTRSKRIGCGGIDFVHCVLPNELQRQLDDVLDSASTEQRSRVS